MHKMLPNMMRMRYIVGEWKGWSSAARKVVHEDEIYCW